LAEKYKIIVVTDSIDIEDSSGSKANVALIANLEKAGFDVTVFHYTRKAVKIQNVKCIEVKEIKWSLFYFLSRFQRILHRKFNIQVADFLERSMGFSFTFFNDVESIGRSLKKIDPTFDLIITLSKGASFRPHYAVLDIPDFHQKWLAYVHDPFPFHFYPRPYNWVDPGYRQKEAFFRNVSEKARYSGFPSQLLQEWMGSYFPDFLKTGCVIPHQNSGYICKEKHFPDYFNPDKFNLLHAGNLMKQRSPEGLIKGFQLFLKNNPAAQKDSCLLLLGPAGYHKEMLVQYSKACPQLFVVNASVPFDTVYNLQKNTTINVILESKSEISPFLPAKFPHCVEANKTILLLAPYYSETRRLLGEEYRYWAEVDEVEKTASIISMLFTLWKDNTESLLLERKDLLEYLSVDTLKNTINKIANG
jgi:hypothetical protein